MQTLKTADSSHLSMDPVNNLASISLPTHVPRTASSSGHRHQHAVSAELSGAGTWIASVAEARYDPSALDASADPACELGRGEVRHQPTRSSQRVKQSKACEGNTPTYPNEQEPRRDSVLTTSIPSVRSHGSYEYIDSDVRSKSQCYDSGGNIDGKANCHNWIVTNTDGSTVAGAEEYSFASDDKDFLPTPEKSEPRYCNENLKPSRPYTSCFNDSVHCPPAVSRAASVISDAGLQQQLRHKQVTVPAASKTEPSPTLVTATNATLDDENVLDLQGRLFHALVPIRKNESNIPDFGFLPQEQLRSVVNAHSVAEQLRMDLSQTHTSEEIDHFANAVCSETEVLIKDKKKLKSFQKIFAILVMVEMSSAISHFLEADVSDIDLPLVPIRQQGTVVDIRRRDSNGIAALTSLRCFSRKLWSLAKLRNFERDQWITLAPFFHHNEHSEVNHYILQDQHILPFVAASQAADDDAEYHGGFAKVMMVHIHPAHHDFTDKMLGARGFAVKQLYEHDRKSFDRESKMLKKFSGGRSHKHIVSLLATYEQREKFHFIFYRAGGDLFKYWKEIEKHPTLSYPNIIWIAEQLAGMADGLMRLHRHLTLTMRYPEEDRYSAPSSPSEERRAKFPRPVMHVRADSMQLNGVRVRPASPTLRNVKFQTNVSVRPKPSDPTHVSDIIEVEQFGRHGDITPGNILWYNGCSNDSANLSGTLKIADFGQAELNSAKSKTSERSVANTLTYRPPECDIQPNVIRQSYDIWCLGCVYLEFVTWVLGGERMLTAFAGKRRTRDRYMNNDRTDTFFEFVESAEREVEVQIKPVVLQFIRQLHRQSSCTEYLHEVLDLIEHDMLVVESKDRTSCEQVRKKLHGLYERCRGDTDYASRPTPWLDGKKWSEESPPRSVKVSMTQEAEQKIAENLKAIPAPPSLQRRRTGLREEQR